MKSNKYKLVVKRTDPTDTLYLRCVQETKMIVAAIFGGALLEDGKRLFEHETESKEAFRQWLEEAEVQELGLLLL